MKKFAIIFAIIGFAFACNNETQLVKNDLQLANLKGNVWKIDRMVHNAKGQCVCPAAEKTDCNKSLFEYNKNGFLVQTSLIDEDGNVASTSKYIYNNKGLCSEVDKFAGEKMTGKELPVFEKGLIGETKYVDGNNTHESTVNYIYNGNDLAEIRTLNSDGTVAEVAVNEYAGGKLVAQTKKDGNGKVISVTRYTRNQNNDITEYSITTSDTGREYKMTFDYEYDNAGNWIKQTQTYNGEVVNIITRNISYFSV